MRRSVVRCCALLLLLLAGPAAAQAQQGPTVAQAEEQVRQIRAGLKAGSAAPETWGALIMAETILLQARMQQAGAVDPAAVQEQQRALAARILAEWKAAQPDDPTPYFAEMQQAQVQGNRPAEWLDDAVLGLLPRFPDNARLLIRVLPILVHREETRRAAELIDGALERHPERSALYGVALGFYRGLGNAARQREVAAAWIEREPANPEALRSWLGMEPASARDPREAAARVERFVAASGPDSADGSRAEVCGWLLAADAGAYRDAALRCLSAIAEQARDPQVRSRAAGFLAGAGGNRSGAQDLAASLAGLPPERRHDAVLNAVHALGEGQCAQKMSLLALLPGEGSRALGRAPDYFGALHGCETDEAARAAYLDALAQAPAADLQQLLGRWFTNVNGRYLDPTGFGPRAATALEGRLRREGSRAEVWQALATAYAIAGWDDRRAAHLTAWLGQDLEPPSRGDLVWLGRYRAAGSGPQALQAGIDVLRTGWRKTHDAEVAAALANLLLAARKTDELAALIDELAAPPADGSAPDPASVSASLARLLRARSALLRQGPEAALADYQAFVDQAPGLNPGEAQEYLLVLAGVRGEPAAAQAAQALCTKGIAGSTAAPSQCAANLLSSLGHAEGALQLLAAAAERAPENMELQASFAWAAEQAGDAARAEQTYRRMLAADPKFEAAWTGLGRLAESRLAESHGDPAELETLLRQAEQARGDRPAELVLALARADLARHRPERTIELLTALRERLPESYLGEEELRQAYADLAAQAPPAARQPAASPATARPTPADLRAARQAEAFLLGLGGAPLDEAKGRDLVQALAARGNLYANIRLGIWQQAGTQGFTADPRRAAATVAPYLAGLRAAAEAGDPFAEYFWGTVLLRGLGVPKQAAEAGVWLHKAAEQGEPWALHNLGWMAENGDKPDLNEAMRWYRRGAEAGNPFSMLSLATLRLEGAPAVRQPAEGVQWLEKAAQHGLPKAVSWYAALLLYGLPGAPPDPARARPWLEKAAALGEVRGLYDLGRALLLGLGGPADERRGVQLLEQAAGQGDVHAMWQLAWQSALGRGTLHDGKRAEQWIAKAAAAGVDEATYILGANPEDDEAARRHFAQGLRALEQLAAAGDAFAGGLAARLYAQGIGVAHDPARALALARPAAAAGSSEAMRVLGWAYRQGDGVEPDAGQAAAWFRRGAEAGNTFCMMWYSQMLFRGEGGPQDGAAALAWLERSGEGGNAWAIRDLGHLYDEGWHGIARDEAKAAYWKRKALAFGDDEARGWLLAHHLSE